MKMKMTIEELQRLKTVYDELDEDSAHWTIIANADSSSWSTVKSRCHHAGIKANDAFFALARAVANYIARADDREMASQKIERAIDIRIRRPGDFPYMRNGVAYTGPDWFDVPNVYQPWTIIL